MAWMMGFSEVKPKDLENEFGSAWNEPVRWLMGAGLVSKSYKGRYSVRKQGTVRMSIGETLEALPRLPAVATRADAREFGVGIRGLRIIGGVDRLRAMQPDARDLLVGMCRDYRGVRKVAA